ncbi:hypothetical protein HQ325_16940 [Rhodococcus sp. BP-349]|nr:MULTISPECIES: hypothetical protein [unclassified Rhodococcus (in: high G+C Gram-positive bacteria)]MBY6597109.1 hypothetical protein [Rhodococcus sp. BP-359]MBY6623135.1 hypothetical protein [Rhodococcus sp. BP-357]MBY6540363.1 hypothetical protein [Rhodococcus sp. BP-363]MBY6545612.1 hypothetical protein [Rhodococcus sp. BP-369]MBY6564842.1 hypothetical protein [Rhodococcus sp. BP-370]
MDAPRPRRDPVPELVLLATGAVLFAVARLLDLDGLFIGSIFLCVFAGLAALFSGRLAQQSLGTKIAATVIGLAVTAFGAVWMITHASSTEIFSPAMIVYPGGGLALSGLINSVTHRASSSR